MTCIAAVLLSVLIFSAASVQAQAAFSCDLITLEPVVNGSNEGFIGASVAFEIINGNAQATTLMRVHLEWPTILDYPGMYASEFALNNHPHWQGMDMVDVSLTTNITDTAIDPSVPPDFFENTPEVDRLIPAYSSGVWTGLFGNAPAILASYLSINQFSGTEFYLFNPDNPSTYCRTGMALPPPPTFPALIRNYFATHTPTITWSGVTWAQGYQIEIDDDPDFKSPLRAQVAANMLAYTASPDLPNDIYYWHVRARKSDSAWGKWSLPETIVVAAP